MKTVYKTIMNIVLIVLVALAAVMVGPRLFGMTPYAVLSASMEPTYHVGSLIYDKEVDPTTLVDGDIVTFKISDSTLVTHRVIAVDPVNKCLYTKGDNNNTPDGGSVSFDDVVGKPVFSIPKLGYLAVYAQTTTGIIVIVTIILAVLILTFLPDFLFDDEEEKKNKADDSGESENRREEE